MRLINRLFNNTSEVKEEKIVPWISLTDVAVLNEIKEKSKERMQLIFKHSTRCGISRMVLSRFEETYALNENEVDLYYLDLLNYRNISNNIASKFGVWHESPQLLIIKNGVVVEHASHGAINEIDLLQFL